MDCSYFGRPCFGEIISGDTAVVRQDRDVVFLAIVDVLGHGSEAHILAERIENFLGKSWSRDVASTMLRLHQEITGTRGAAVGICSLEIATGRLSYAGVGNTVLRRFGPRSARLHSIDGTVGLRIRTPRVCNIELTGSDVVLLHTDGVKNRFELEDYPQMLYQNTRTVASSIVNRFGRKFDDATCIVLRYGP